MKSIYAILMFLCGASVSNAIVIRDDVNPELHLNNRQFPLSVVNAPDCCHAVLVAPQWLVTVSHLVSPEYIGQSISIGGKQYTISHVVMHYLTQEPPESVFVDDTAPMQEYKFNNDDIALIRLSTPVSDIAPLPLYREQDEVGKVVKLYGSGASGDGLTGERDGTAGIMQMAENLINQVTDKWMVYTFDTPGKALPLEGIEGDGDSGGPLIIIKDDKQYLAGLTSWQKYSGLRSAFVGGLYGRDAYAVRISNYVKWIDEIQSLPLIELEMLDKVYK